MKAVYLVFSKLDKKKNIEIGALGQISFKPGTYIYVGSAMNSAEKRIERHFSEVENKHWHIDYFTAETEQTDYFILPEKSEYECIMASILSEFCTPIDSFGASDCSCDSHLFRAPEDISASTDN